MRRLISPIRRAYRAWALQRRITDLELLLSRLVDDRAAIEREIDTTTRTLIACIEQADQPTLRRRGYAPGIGGGHPFNA